MEHSLDKLTESIVWGVIFIGFLAELINNIVKMGAAEGIIVFAGFSIVTGSLFVSSIRTYINSRH